MHARRAARPGRSALPGSLAAVLAAAILAAGACAPAVPFPTPSPSARPSPSASPSVIPSGSAANVSPTPSLDTTALYAAIEGQVVAIRGLKPKTAVEPKILGENELRVRVAAAFKEDNPPEIVAANDKLLKGLGLFPSDASLSDLYVELLSSTVAGFYNPKDKQLIVVSKSGAIGPVERVTFSHEYTHALQDQNFDIQSFDLAAVGQGDRGLARLSLIEGDATAVMTDWAQQNLSSTELIELLRASLDPAALKILEKMPPILREPLGFPYDNGLRFVLGLRARGGWAAVDAAFGKPPASSEQILHPEKYDAGEAPIEVAIPKDLAARMGDGWKVSLEDTLGEFQLGIWVRIGLTRVPLANAATDGWGGDRVALLEGPGGAWAIAMLTTWDTATDAAEFADGAGQVLTKLGTPGTVNAPPGGKSVTILLGSDAEWATKLDTILGDTGA